MIRPFYLNPNSMNALNDNSISIPTEEFYDTYKTIEELLTLEVDPTDFIVLDPFLASSPVKVDLRKHLQSLYDRMTEIRESLTASTEMVTIDFNWERLRTEFKKTS